MPTTHRTGPPRPTRGRTPVDAVRRRASGLPSSAPRYARLVRLTPLRISTPAATHGAIREATRNGRPEFQGVAANQTTRGTVPRATAGACRPDRDAATKNAAAPSSTNDPSP